jgi:hypothetical protein
MAEEGPATPGWVEQRLEEIWSGLYMPGTDAVLACRNAYLTCLATCEIGADPDRCHDTCRADCLTCLRRARVASDTLASLEAELEALEAEISDTT